MMIDTLKRVIPDPLWRAARDVWREQAWWRAMRSLAALPAGVVPGRPLLRALRTAWDNDGFSADVPYLEEVARQVVQTPGPVLECGSGLTTLLLGVLAQRRGVAVVSLEHDAGWLTRVSQAVQRHRIGTTRVLFAPLRNYGDFTWYDPPTDEVPDGIRLVVCDGPPGSTPGGRYGLLPVLGDRLDPGAVVLLDDAERATETHVLERWRAERALEVQHFRPSRSGYAVITL